MPNPRETLESNAFDAAWLEGNTLSTGEAISDAQRDRGARRRPDSGWESLTPTELDVVRLVSEGLPNKDIGVRMFISPRTVQSHLRHVDTKLAVSPRVHSSKKRPDTPKAPAARLTSANRAGASQSAHRAGADLL
jgi:DNA-binding CsgD family transcriptional regulator